MEPGGQGGQEEDSAHLCLGHPGLLATPGRLPGKSQDPRPGLQPSRTEGVEGVRPSFPPSSPALAGEASWAETGVSGGCHTCPRPPGSGSECLQTPTSSPHLPSHSLAPAPKGPPSLAGPSTASPSKNCRPCPRAEEGASSHSRGGGGIAQPSAASGPPRAVFTMLLAAIPKSRLGVCG